MTTMITDAERMSLSGTGYFVRHAVDVSNPAASLLELAHALGRPYASFPHVMDVRPEAGRAPVSSGGTARFPPHTDHAWHATPPRYIIMCCLTPGSPGSGLPTVTDADAITELTAREQQTLGERVVWFPPPPSTGWPGYYGRILEPPLMRVSAAMANGDHGDVAGKLYAAILRRETTLDIARGTVWVVDNHRCCHGRTELREGLASKRHLFRLYGE